MQRASYLCRLCGETALTLELRHEPGDAHATLLSTSFWGQSSEPIDAQRLSALEAALAGQDPLAIYRLNRLWTPAYCAECACSYCRAHWQILPQFDDDFPGWYDCAYGICPQGHRRLVDD